VKKLDVNKQGASRTEAEADKEADIGKAADKVNKAETPHKDKGHPPGLSVVLFAKLDKESAKKAEEAIGKVKGVDKKNSKANAEKGEISIKIDGKEKLKVDDLTKALDGAGIKATTTKEEEKKKG
jgi:hypothetical protein